MQINAGKFGLFVGFVERNLNPQNVIGIDKMKENSRIYRKEYIEECTNGKAIRNLMRFISIDATRSQLVRLFNATRDTHTRCVIYLPKGRASRNGTGRTETNRQTS